MKDHPGRWNPVELAQYLVARYQSTICGTITILVMVTQAQVVASQPYGENYEISKLECIGHIQKRLGTRLRRLMQSYKGQILRDGKKLTGRGRLTLKTINQLQNYFGLSGKTPIVYLRGKGQLG